MVWAVKGNELRIGWYSLAPVYVAENGSLVTLKLITTNAFTAGQTMDISLPFDPLNELADGNFDGNGKRGFMVAKVGNGVAASFDLAENDGLLLSNYPNPFSQNTTTRLHFAG